MVSRARVTSVAVLALLLAACSIERSQSGRPGGAAATPPDSAAAAEVSAALRLYYARVTARDWGALATSFWPRATITHIRGRGPGTEGEAGASDPGRVETATIEQAIREAAAMKECPASHSDEIARATVVTYGPLADAWVTYRFRCGVTRDSVTTHYGIDAFQLLRQDGEWRISGLAFTHEIAGEPLSRQ